MWVHKIFSLMHNTKTICSPLSSPTLPPNPQMLWFKNPFPSPFKNSALTSSLTSFLSLHHEHLLLSLLHRHRHRHHKKRSRSLQVHAHLLTTALHAHQLSDAGIVIWNTLIRLYSHGPSPQQSILLYKQMLSVCTHNPPTDTFTFSFLLKACANFSSPGVGTQLHSVVIKKGFAFHLYVHTAVGNMYATCGWLVDAKRAFDEMPERSSVSWNVMITGFAKWGELEQARILFERMPSPNVVSWTGLIDGYTRIHQPNRALALFRRMSERGIMPSEITVLAIVPSISNLGSLELGETLHAHCQKRALITLDVRVENSLIDMYAKCGSIENTKKVFERMSGRRNLVSWTSIITGFAAHGMANEAIQLFDEMRKEENISPNSVTFLSVLNACSHGGLVEEGLRFFSSMVHEYGIEPEIKHYGCLIDMLGRAGRLREAEETIRGVPVEVNVVVWRTLLGCCSKHGEVEMGERVMKRMMELGGEYGGDYVVLANMLQEAGRFWDAERVRSMVDERKLVKVPGLSLVGGKV